MADEHKSEKKVTTFKKTVGGAVEPKTFTDGLPLPKILIFDLDFTLWPAWSDFHVTPPLKSSDSGKTVIDKTGESFSFFPEVPSVLAAISAHDIPIGAASRTMAPDIAESLLKMLKVPLITKDQQSTSTRAIDLFNYKEIYPGDKRTHIKKIHKSSSIAFEDMLFFDDESRNSNVESLGACFWLIRDGVTKAEIDLGIREWRRRRSDRS